MITMVAPRYALTDEEAEALWLRSKDDESFLSEMRRRGAYKIESIRALRRLKGIDLSAAKESVHFSPVWDDTRGADEAMHEACSEALDILQRENDHALTENIAS